MMRTYYELAKPGIVYGNALTAVAAFIFASHRFSEGRNDVLLLGATVLGLSLAIAGACVVNNILDRDIDKHMERTKDRPLVTGAVSVRSAFIYGLLLLVTGFGILISFTNVYAVCATVLGVLVYLSLYTPAKRTTQHSTIIGSVAGAVPPVVGYAAVAHTIDVTSVLLFLILVCWQMTHFFAIAIFRKDEYQRAKLPIMSVRAGVTKTKALMLIYAVLFAYAALLLGYTRHLGQAYRLSLLALSVVWIALSVYGFWAPDERRWARQLFFYSLLVLLGFSGALAIS